MSNQIFKKMAKAKVPLMTVIVVMISSSSISAEEPFCSNKCHDTGIATSKVCHCDSLCASMYNDCCGDSEHISKTCGLSVSKRNSKMTCKKIAKSDVSAFVIDDCPVGWKGPETVRDSCRDPLESSSDPISEVPVTNALLGTTYKNYHCAICNGGVDALEFWRIKITCPTMNANMLELDRQEVLKYIVYNQKVGEWGFSVVNTLNNRKSFHSCLISYTVPKALRPKIRQCDPDLVSMCSSAWKDDLIKHMCSSYVDPLYSEDGATKYRNLYCAICNGIDLSQLSCGKGMGPRQHESLPGSEDLGGNFALLLDVDTADGDVVGQKTIGVTCNKEEIFDPFVKACRNIVCGIPGYTLKENKCVRKTSLPNSDQS